MPPDTTNPITPIKKEGAKTEPIKEGAIKADIKQAESTKAGFVAIIGRPNAGKSTLLNALINEQIALVSHKINATRKRSNIIVMHKNAQIIFIDTPGIHRQEKLLNKFMLEESLKAIEDCDLVLFLAPLSDDLKYYREFLELSKGKRHILLLSKIDLFSNDEILAKLSLYEEFSNSFKALIPISSAKGINLSAILDEILPYLPYSPYFYDTDIISTQNLKEIYKEKIREALFAFLNKEIPYQSDVIVKRVLEGENLDKIYAEIIVEKDSQKIIIIGKNGSSIKNIGISARKSIESFSGKKVFLKLDVVVKKGWSKDKKMLKNLGYDM